MAIRSGFFNSVNGDRRYLANNFAEYFSTFIGNGVFPDPAIGLQVQAKLNMTITVKPGKGWINGYYLINDGDFDLTISNADGVLNRIDRVVMRWDINTRNIVVQLKKGAFASSPVAPALQRDQEIFELALADIYVAKGITSISQSAITDKRLEKSLCGIVSGVVDQIDTTNLFTQYNVSFNEWFDTVKDYLNDTAVGNVANKLAEHTLDESAHNLGTAPLKTNSKTIKEAINEVFTSGNNVKKNVVDTLLSLDNTLPINTNSTWDKITASLPNVSGKSPMNVYIQPTEPVKKEGIWFKTAESNKPDVEDYKYTSNVNSLNNSITKVANPLYYTGGLVLHENNLFHIYSMSSNSIYVNKYDTKTALWSVVTTFTESTGSLSSQSACVIDDTLYFVSSVKGRINTLNLKTNTRSYIQLDGSADWRARKLCAVGDVIYGFGDNLGNGYNNRLASYNVKTGKFSILADNPSNYLISSAHFYNGKLLCGQETYQDPKFYNISSNTWSNGLEMPVNNYKGLSFVATSNAEFYSFGGIEGSYFNLTSSYVFNELQNVWSLAGTSPVGRDLSVCLGPEGNSIYTLGSHKANNFTENEFHRINYNHNIIKGVNIENSSKIYDASLLAVKVYPNLMSITNNVTTAYISKDGKSKLRGIPTYVGAGSSWQLTNIK